ncbi:Rid family hydrolase [Streptomyces sp. NPDC006872]|uniref:RidA family protein n=1 Tax=Streptomyces sp. NPDC006872 TaxID=3155720 RepID=UPI0033E3D5B4
MTVWYTNRTPEPPHPFSHSVTDGDWVLISGIGGHDAAGAISDDLETQVRTAIGTLSELLAQAGSSLSEIVYFRPYVSEREHMEGMDKLLHELLPRPRPAGGALTIGGLADPRMKVEFEAWARRGAILVERHPETGR